MGNSPRWRCCVATSSALVHSPQANRAIDDAVRRLGEAQNVACHLFDQIRIREVGPQKCDISLELGTHGLEASDFEVQQAGPLDQNFAGLETVSAIHSVIGEIGCRSEAEKQNQRLP